MANDKEQEQSQEQEQHIPTEPKEEEKKDSGSGGLLSMVGDPAGLSLSHSSPIIFPSPFPFLIPLMPTTSP
jgi:hypothetical protein